MSALAVAQPIDLVTIREAGTTLTAAQAAEVTAEIRGALDHAQRYLRIAFAGKAHEVLGYGTGMAGWDAYFSDNFGDVVFALSAEQRKLEVAKWMEVGASARVMAKALKASLGTISTDRKELGGPGEVVSLDGRRRDAAAASATAVAAKAKPAKPLTLRVEELLLAAGATGMTSEEIGARLRIGHNRYSPTMTRLEQQRRVVRLGDKREKHGIYRHPAWTLALTQGEDVIDAEIVG